MTEKPKTPSWWTSAHANFRVDFERQKKDIRVILVNEIRDTITIRLHRKSTDEWELEYTKIVSERHNSFRAILHMTRYELQSAFGLIEKPKNEPAWSARFDLECGVEGCFARTGNYLNIPNPCISMEKDSSISIHITPAIKRAVAHLFSE